MTDSIDQQPNEWEQGRSIRGQFMFGLRFGLGLIVAQLVFALIAGLVFFGIIRSAFNTSDTASSGDVGVEFSEPPLDQLSEFSEFESGEMGVPSECVPYVGNN